MTLDQWLILGCGLLFLTIPLGLLVADHFAQRRRRRAVDAHTALWNDEIGKHDGECEHVANNGACKLCGAWLGYGWRAPSDASPSRSEPPHTYDVTRPLGSRST